MGKSVAESARLERERIERYRFLIGEYQLVKSGQHPVFRRAGLFYQAHNLDRRVFLKYYHRYGLTASDESLLPRKRGPKWRARADEGSVLAAVERARSRGQGRYEIAAGLRTQLGGKSPSASTVYRILCRLGRNRLKPEDRTEKRRIIKTMIGELGHTDCHTVRSGTVLSPAPGAACYVVGMIDDASRVAAATLVPDLTALSVMFACLRMLSGLSMQYGIQFAAMMTDNGAEFGRKDMKTRSTHPVARLFDEMNIRQIYTKPYRPQTNGKIERFWKTLNEDLLEDATYQTVEALEEELQAYLVYYNEHRPHQACEGKTPLQALKSMPHVTIGETSASKS